MMPEISGTRQNRSEAPRTVQIEARSILSHLSRNATQAIDGAHRFSFFAFEAAMMITRGDLDVGRSSRHVCVCVFVLSAPMADSIYDIRQTMSDNGLQRFKLEVLILVLIEAAYEASPAAAHDELVSIRLETRLFEAQLVSLGSE